MPPKAVKGAFPPPQRPGVALLRSLQAGAAWIWWREEDRQPSPYFLLVQGQALLHAEGMATMKWGAIIPNKACRWITAAAPQPMRSPTACQRLLRAVPPLVPRHALKQEVWSAMLSHPREWMMNPGTRYPPGPVLEQLTAPTPGVRRTLHSASALTETAHRRGAPHPACGHVKLPGPPGVAAPGRGRTPERRGGTVVDTPQSVHRASPLVPAPTALPPPEGPGAPPAEPVPHAPGAPGRAELPAAGPAHPPAGAGPGGTAAGPPARHGHHGAAKGSSNAN